MTGKMLSPKCLKLITCNFNAILKTNHFPATCKIAQIMIGKTGKNPEKVTTFRPISLLLNLSKFSEKIYVKQSWTKNK